MQLPGPSFSPARTAMSCATARALTLHVKECNRKKHGALQGADQIVVQVVRASGAKKDLRERTCALCAGLLSVDEI